MCSGVGVIQDYTVPPACRPPLWVWRADPVSLPSPAGRTPGRTEAAALPGPAPQPKHTQCKYTGQTAHTLSWSLRPIRCLPNQWRGDTLLFFVMDIAPSKVITKYHGHLMTVCGWFIQMTTSLSRTWINDLAVSYPHRRIYSRPNCNYLTSIALLMTINDYIWMSLQYL